MRSRGFVRLLTPLALAVLAVGPVGAAVRDNPQVQFTAADKSLAGLIVLQKSDLPKLDVAWKGGAVKPNLQGEKCPDYRESDLVLTGAASSNFESAGAVAIHNDVWLLQTSAMVKLDQQRLPSTAVELACIRASFADAPATVRFVSASLLAFPHVAPYTHAVRAVFDFTSGGETTRLLEDEITVFKDRAEAVLHLTTAYSVRNEAKTLEVSLAKAIAGRATTPKIIGYSIRVTGSNVMPTAGTSFKLGVLNLKLDRVLGVDNTGSISMLLPPDTISCIARLGGAPIAATGKEGCRWQLPGDATGKRLVVFAHVTLMGAEKTLTIPFTVG